MLFGHQNDDTGQPAGTTLGTPPPPPPPGVNPLAVDPSTGASLPTTDPVTTPQPLDLSESSVLNQPTEPASPAPEAEQTDPEPTPTEPMPINPPAATTSTDDTSSDASANADSDTSDASPAPSGDELLTLKQQAISQLSPLVDQLDQTPEEKFRTTMMLIQSTDDPSRLQAAYDAAQAIPDEKVRAQALLDVVNEINYFTQKNQ